MEELLSAALTYKDRGISVLDKHLDDHNWSVGQSILFTVTVVTTIGYGHVAPLTAGGKLFCLFYAALGIPFTLIFLSAAVQRLLEPSIKILNFLFNRMDPFLSPFGIRVMHLSFMNVLFIVFFLIVPSIIFWRMEATWDFVDAFYFVFISLTTIGLGDYIPGDDEGQRYREIYKVSVARKQ